MRLLPAFFIGLVFGTGILLSGMANPAKVLNFFDLAGHWDPSLALVMGGALTVTFIGYRFTLARNRPLFDSRFTLPSSKTIDSRLVAGAGLFGIGWGVVGICPGAAIPAAGSLNLDVLLFLPALIGGIFLARLIPAKNPVVACQPAETIAPK